MADMRITNVPQASSVTTSNDFYVKIGTTFRRVPISALVTLFQSDGFVKRTTVDGITQDLMAVEHVVLSGDGVYVSNRSYSQIAAVLDLNYMIEAELNTGNSLEYSYRGLFLCAENGSAIFAFIDPHDANDPRLLIMTVTDQNYMTGVSVESYPLNDSGGGGTADVTPTAVATAISGMNTSQKNDSRQALNAEIAGAAAAVQTNVNAILALIPSSASQNNQLATKNDLPTLTDRNSSTDTVEVKKDPTTQKLYVPTYPSGGAIDPADIVNATGQMDTTQQTSTRQNIGAEQAGAAAAVQTNLNAVTEKIPSNASSSNKLATQSDLPVFSNRNASTDTVEVKQDPTSKRLYVPAGSSGGISKTVVTISGSTCDTSLADIIAAYQNGNVIECWADGLQCWLGYPPNEFGATFFGVDSDSGNTLYAYALAPNGTVTVFSAHIGNADKPEQIPLEGTTPTIAFAGDNAIYTGGTLTSLTVTQFGNSGMFMLIFDSGSSPTSLNLPVYDSAHPTNNYVKWGDFTVEANKHYEVSVNVINGVGYLVGKGW